jgi:hypothetical protein
MKMLYILIWLCFVTAASFSDVMADSVRVITKENAVREDCRFFAPIKLKVCYGDIMQALEKQGDWYRVQIRGVIGCIHQSAVSGRVTSISAPAGSSRGASHDETTLAGKGFDQQIENAYRRRNSSSMNYQTVDWVERITIPSDRIQNFIIWGGLRRP